MPTVAAAVLFAATAVLAAKLDFNDAQLLGQAEQRVIVPGRYIVELSSSTGKRSESVHDEFLGELDKRAAGKFVTRKKYDSPIFSGITVELKAPEDVVNLASIPNVVAVRPVHMYPGLKPVKLHVASGPEDPAVLPYGQSTHIMTGVDRVHAQGFTGKGIKIAILDTGIDYNHPTLGGGFGPGFKIAGGYDFVGDDYSFFDPVPVPDDDPLDTCMGHGTHVAGIIGANPGNEFNITGVAYEATLYAYRVLGCAGWAGDDVIIDAMLRAYNEDMDIITMSIGGSDNWSDEPISVVASRIAAAGKVVTISAGNDGAYGPFFFSAPATGKDVISVASVENVVRTYQTATTNVAHAPVPYVAVNYELNGLGGQPLDVPETPFPIYALQSDPLSNSTGCSPLGDDVPDLSGYVVVFRSAMRPVDYSIPNLCFVDDQVRNIGAKGARMFMIYNPMWTPFVMNFPHQTALLRNYDDGAFLVNEFNKGSNITVTFRQQSGVDVPNKETGGLTSSFSSFGPTQDVLFKPAVGAPGGNITSTYLTNHGSWAVASGTSMAAPFMAGSAALLLQARGKAIAKNARTILQSTAVGLPASRDKDALPHTLAQQGAGLINVFDAINVQSEVSPGELLLNDTAHWKSVHKIVIKNSSKRKQTYDLSHQPAGTAVTMPTGHYLTKSPVPLINAPVTVRLSQTRVTLAPGASTTVIANISPPKHLGAKTLPVVSGWIRITGSLGDRLQVSYLGVAGSMHDAETISTQNTDVLYPHLNLPAIAIPELRPDNYTQPQIGPRNYTRESSELMWFGFLLAQNTARFVIDLIDAKTKVKATIPVQQDVAKRALWPWLPGMPVDRIGGSFDDIPIVTRVAEGVRRMHLFLPNLQDDYSVNLPLTINGGDPLPYGQYKFLLRVLKPFGNPKLEKDYDVYVSETVGFVESL